MLDKMKNDFVRKAKPSTLFFILFSMISGAVIVFCTVQRAGRSLKYARGTK